MKIVLTAITVDDFSIDLHIAYATSSNFTGRPLYKRAAAFLHSEAITCLNTAIILAKEIDLRLKIFDTYRPLEVQEELWSNNPDPNFISNPKSGSIPHCRGVAVDLTLVDKSGSELDMGTGFDSFSPRSYHGNMEISTEAQRNRFILMGIMTSAGWDFYRNEWWHYQLFNPRNYPALRDSEAGTDML